jgi:hypothetical protein
MTNTPIYGIPLPTPGADDDAWAPILNDGIIDLEARVKQNDDSAVAHAARRDNPHLGGGGLVGGYTKPETDALLATSAGTDQVARDAAAAAQADIDAHEARTDNPHNVTAAAVGALTQATGDMLYVNIDGDTMTGGLALPEGAAFLPSLRIGGGGNTGLFRDGDALAFAVGATVPFAVGPSVAEAFVPVLLPAAAPTGQQAVSKAHMETRLLDLQGWAETGFVNTAGDTMTGALVVDTSTTTPALRVTCLLYTSDAADDM